ncbi:unnamed protein product [Rhodiola kirilowii]
MSTHMQVWLWNPNSTTSWLKPTTTLPKALMRNMDTPPSKRSICPSCSKPPRTCLCTRFQSPPLDNSVSVTILQHTLERNHPLNSTRIAKLGLKNLVIANVRDVLTQATFVISLLGDDEHGVPQKMVSSTQAVCENVKMESAEAEFSENANGEMPVCDIKMEMDKYMCADGDIDPVFADSLEAPTITITMGRRGSQCSCEFQLLPQLSSHKLRFDQLLTVPRVVSGFANGFLVKRMQDTQFSIGSCMERQTEFMLNVPRGSVLLFPSENAVDVKDLESRGIEAKNLIVLDGTWAKATRMYNENPWLKALPHLKLELDKSSLYGEVRTQPKKKCLSTIESIVYALKAVGDCPDGLDGLLDVFESMVGDQRRCMHERLNNLSHAVATSYADVDRTLAIKVQLIFSEKNEAKTQLIGQSWLGGKESVWNFNEPIQHREGSWSSLDPLYTILPDPNESQEKINTHHQNGCYLWRVKGPKASFLSFKRLVGLRLGAKFSFRYKGCSGHCFSIGGRRWGSMTTNVSESFNHMLMACRDLPITAIVHFTFKQVNAWFIERRDALLDHNKYFVPMIESKNNANLVKSTQCKVQMFDRSKGIASVLTKSKKHTHKVSMEDKTCDYGKWQLLHYPCHALAVWEEEGISIRDCVAHEYSTQSCNDTWSYTFNPQQDITQWKEYVGPKHIPNK